MVGGGSANLIPPASPTLGNKVGAPPPYKGAAAYLMPSADLMGRQPYRLQRKRNPGGAGQKTAGRRALANVAGLQPEDLK